MYEHIKKLAYNYKLLLHTINVKVNPHYLKNDEAHQLDHALDVLNELLYINEKLNYTDNITLLIVAAMYHDIFSNKEDRSKHHILASEYILKDKYISTKLSTKDVLKASIMIREHRASFKGKRSSTLSDMLSIADIGRPDLKSMIIRSLKYHNGNRDGVIEHLKEKFGHNGYINHSDLYIEMYKDEIEKLKDDIDKLVDGIITIDDILGE